MTSNAVVFDGVARPGPLFGIPLDFPPISNAH
jgi:hypothetical protein